MDQFRQLMSVALLSGAVAGVALFSLQHLTMRPLIQEAEAFEVRARRLHDAESLPAPHQPDISEEPAGGWRRTSLTALATVLTGVAFAALLFGIAFLCGVPLDASRGLRWGLAGFACFVLAPALGLPPEPPGVVAAGLPERQLWWLSTAAAAGGGLLLLRKWRQGWLVRLAGLAAIVLPHIVGAPETPAAQIVPEDLIRRFQIASIATNGVFWILLGGFGGFLSARWGDRFEGFSG